MTCSEWGIWLAENPEILAGGSSLLCSTVLPSHLAQRNAWRHVLIMVVSLHCFKVLSYTVLSGGTIKILGQAPAVDLLWKQKSRASLRLWSCGGTAAAASCQQDTNCTSGVCVCDDDPTHVASHDQRRYSVWLVVPTTSKCAQVRSQVICISIYFLFSKEVGKQSSELRMTFTQWRVVCYSTSHHNECVSCVWVSCVCVCG